VGRDEVAGEGAGGGSSGGHLEGGVEELGWVVGGPSEEGGACTEEGSRHGESGCAYYEWASMESGMCVYSGR
jgi:hypothetical protein